VGCSALSLVGLFEGLRWDTLFVEVPGVSDCQLGCVDLACV
jgi:hypothetical protein